MTEIPLLICGDYWANKHQVLEQLTTTNDIIILNARAEGASLISLGVVDTIVQSGHDPANIFVRAWPNNVESVPMKLVDTYVLSHFFPMSKRYLQLRATHLWPTRYRMALFIGRKTISRLSILHALYQRPQVLCSLMLHHQQEINLSEDNLEKLNDWQTDNLDTFLKFYHRPDVRSIDNQWVADQYNADHNTNRSLLNHYDLFAIEVACETYTIGETFFPTEKTIRPIMGNKAFMIYGPINFLHRLRQLGFKTFSSLWDESYDQYQGPARWKKMQQQIQLLLDLDDQQFAHTIKQAIPIVEHNKQLLLDILKNYDTAKI